MTRESLHEDRLFPAEPTARAIARRLYSHIRELPIVSPHGHTDPAWFATNHAFADPASLLLVPDHYLLRLLYSHGIPLESLGVPRLDGPPVERDPRAIWRRFAGAWHFFRGTPSNLWLTHAMRDVFGVEERLDATSADRIYDRIADCLARPEFRPRALFDRFRIEVLATTEGATDPLEHHAAIRASGWKGRVITAFRPDEVVDPESGGFVRGVERLGEMTGENTATWSGYLRALAVRRRFFASMGATSTDHGHPSAATFDLSRGTCEALFGKALDGRMTAHEAEQLRGQMLTEMALMSIEDGLVMQIHPGSFRNHNQALLRAFGRDRGADIPTPTEYVRALHPLLNRVGNDPRLTLIVFTLDESVYSRELAPLAGHYPALRVGPAWWFLDSPEGMRIHRERITETAGFYRGVGFNDDTRAFLSIPARHDMARRADCAFLARWVVEHRIDEDDAFEIAADLAYGLAKRAYKL